MFRLPYLYLIVLAYWQCASPSAYAGAQEYLKLFFNELILMVFLLLTCYFSTATTSCNALRHYP